MRFVPSFVVSAVLLLSVNADLEKSSNKNRRAVLAARQLENTPLPAAIKRDLLSMNPEEYELFPRAAGDGIHFNPGGSAHDNEDNWVNGHGPGHGNCINSNVALTLDDGPYHWTKNVSDQFVAADATVNFFVNGYNWDCIYEKTYVQQMRRAFDAGHAFWGSHTWGHVNLTDGVTAEQIDTQIELLETALWKILGVVPRFFRPPYGETNKTVIDYLEQKHGLVIVQWSDDNGDASGDPPETSIEMYKTFKAGENHLVLGHEVKEPTVGQIVPFALKHFKDQGVTPTSLQNCIKGNHSPYKLIGKRQKRDDTWTCDGTPAPGKVE